MAAIKVLGFEGSEIKTKFADVGLYQICERVDAAVRTDEGVLRYTMLPGFLTDMRSGSSCIDGIIPKFTENNRYNLAILCHDFGYTRNLNGAHYLSRILCDELLRQMAILSGEIGAIRAALMYRAVRIFGGGAYDSANDKDYGGRAAECPNFMRFRWDAR